MVAWSRFFSTIDQKLLQSNGLFGKSLSKGNNVLKSQAGSIRCMSGHRVMEVTASRWQWHKTKDWMHFYFFVGAIPAFTIIFCTNVFIGPATLEEIPDGYRPQPWEYYRHPITRFLARYVYPNQQQEYEKLLCYTVDASEKQRLAKLQGQFNRYVQDYADYKHWTYDARMGATQVLRLRERMEKSYNYPID